MMNEDNKEEIAATGELFRQAKSGSKAWTLRKFVLAGFTLSYFTKDGELKGKIDISRAQLRLVTPEEVGSKNARFAFAITSSNGVEMVLCASSERNRLAWMVLLHEQIEEYYDFLRRHLKTGEEVYANAVIKKKNALGISYTVRLVITNLPRILFLDPKSIKVQDNLPWERSTPPTLTKESETKFRINFGKTAYKCEDPANGTIYWEEVFRRFPDMIYYVPIHRPTLHVDFNEREQPANTAVPPALKNQSASQRAPAEDKFEGEDEVIAASLREFEALQQLQKQSEEFERQIMADYAAMALEEEKKDDVKPTAVLKVTEHVEVKHVAPAAAAPPQEPEPEEQGEEEFVVEEVWNDLVEEVDAKDTVSLELELPISPPPSATPSAKAPEPVAAAPVAAAPVAAVTTPVSPKAAKPATVEPAVQVKAHTEARFTHNGHEFSYADLQRRLETKSKGTKPPVFVPPSSDNTLRAQYFGTHRLMLPAKK